MKQLTDIPIFVINLDCRKDRWEQVQEMFLEKSIINYERIEAIKTDKGYYGCVLSHIKALQKAKLEDLPEVLIMEDDFHFVGDGKFHYPQECDVCLYSCLLTEKEDYPKGRSQSDTYNKNFYKVNKAQHTDFYLVKQHYYDKLILTFTESLMNLLNEYEKENYLDVYWKKAQDEDLFLCAKKRLGFQRKGYSDIKNHEMDRETSLD